MNKKIVFMGVFALFGAMHMQKSIAHKMACININNATASGALVIACEYPLATITCEYADFAYTTLEGYRCFVKFDPTKTALSKALNAPAFAAGTGTTEQNCGFINFNVGSGINFVEINKTIQSTSVGRKRIADLLAALKVSASDASQFIKIEYCLTPGKKAVNDAMTFLGHTTVSTPSSQALSVAQQKQQAQVVAQQKAAVLAQATVSAQAAKAKASVAEVKPVVVKPLPVVKAVVKK